MKRGICSESKEVYDYLWIAELLYLALGLTNILFAWLGMLFFSIPLFNRLIRRSRLTQPLLRKRSTNRHPGKQTEIIPNAPTS